MNEVAKEIIKKWKQEKVEPYKPNKNEKISRYRKENAVYSELLSLAVDLLLRLDLKFFNTKALFNQIIKEKVERKIKLESQNIGQKALNKFESAVTSLSEKIINEYSNCSEYNTSMLVQKTEEEKIKQGDEDIFEMEM